MEIVLLMHKSIVFHIYKTGLKHPLSAILSANISSENQLMPILYLMFN